MEESFVKIIDPVGNTCRCCLSYSEDPMENIFESVYDQIELHEILTLLAPVTISVDDGFSKSICESCKLSAVDSYHFRQTCIASDDYIHSAHQEDESVEEYEEEVLVDDTEINEDSLEPNIELVNVHVMSDDEPSSYKGARRKHKCYVCSKSFETPYKLKRHMIVHRDLLDPSEIPERPPKDYKYMCEICDKRVETPSKLTRHMRVHDVNSRKYYGINQHRPYSCADCDMRFWDSVKLERHQVIHSKAFKQSEIRHAADHMFTCVVCLQKLPEYDDCIQHMKIHRDDYGENSEISCKLCSKSYPKLTSLIRHSRSHDENATHMCVHCGKQMGMGEDFIDHLLRHQGFKPFVCDFQACGKSFIKLHKLKQHMSTHVDTLAKPFACTECDKSFSSADYLKRHLLRHSGQKDHACHICPARFTFKSGLTSHMVTHSMVKMFACDTCSASFNKMQTLRNHQKIHVGDKKYACDLCSMRFITIGHLRRHERTHSGIKPYQCTHCPKAYTQSNDLVKHLRKHLGPNVYKCDIGDCQEAFAKFNELKNHKLMHYGSGDMVMEEDYGGEIDSMKIM